MHASRALRCTSSGRGFNLPVSVRGSVPHVQIPSAFLSQFASTQPMLRRVCLDFFPDRSLFRSGTTTQRSFAIASQAFGHYPWIQSPWNRWGKGVSWRGLRLC